MKNQKRNICNEENNPNLKLEISRSGDHNSNNNNNNKKKKKKLTEIIKKIPLSYIEYY